MNDVQPSESSPGTAALGVFPSGHLPRLVAKVILGLISAFGLAVVCGTWFGAPLERAGVWAVTEFGLSGLGLGVLVVDVLPAPLSTFPFMVLALEGGLAFGAVFVVISVASYISGLLGYCIGRRVGLPEAFDRAVRRRFPEGRALLETHGAYGVAICGLAPLPLALGSWTAGALGVRASHVAVALLVRAPKTLVYLVFIEQGLSFGTA